MSRVTDNFEGCKKLQLVWLKNMWIVLGTHKGDIRPLVEPVLLPIPKTVVSIDN